MNDDLVAAAILVATGLLLVLVRTGLVSQVLVSDLWPALLLAVGLYYIYQYIRRQSSTT